MLSKLSARSPRSADPPAASLQKIQLGKLWNPLKSGTKATEVNGESRQVSKRRLPETSESSSQDSSSDSEDPLRMGVNESVRKQGAVGGADVDGSGASASCVSGAPRLGMPSIRPNAMRNRQKQLEALKRYEDRIKRQMKHEGEKSKQHQAAAAVGPAAASSDESDGEFVPACIQQQRPLHPMYVHALDVSKAVSEGTVTWMSVDMDSSGKPPEETTLCSLVCGRGEVIMFGGIQTDANSMQTMGMNFTPQVVSNKLYFIKAQHHFR